MDTSKRLWIAIVAVLALGLGACDQKPSPERSADPAVRQLEGGKERKSGQVGKAIDDAAVTTKVKSVLITAPGLKSADIDVETDNGVVTLQGTTDTAEHRQKAAQLASNVDGVRAVKNQIVVKGT
jgi:osmotically-inducible protein OsmY